MTYQAVYAIAQFRPYSETEEFANIGIVLCAPKIGFFNYQLERTGFKRITSFFNELDARMPRKAVEYLDAELARVRQHAESCSPDMLLRLFNEAVKLKEGIICFSSPRVLLTATPEAKLVELYQHYINHSFVRAQSHNERLEKAMKEMLVSYDLDRFYRQKDIADELGLVKARIPFTNEREGRIFKAIKPISLVAEDSSKIVENGDKWISKFKRLIDNGIVNAENLLIPLEETETQTSLMKNAVKEVARGLKSINVRTIPSEDTSAFIEFARIN